MLKRQRNSTSLIGIEGVGAFRGVLWALVHSTLNQLDFVQVVTSRVTTVNGNDKQAI